MESKREIQAEVMHLIDRAIEERKFWMVFNTLSNQVEEQSIYFCDSESDARQVCDEHQQDLARYEIYCFEKREEAYHLLQTIRYEEAVEEKQDELSAEGEQCRKNLRQH